MLGNETFGDLSLTIAQVDCQLGRENCRVADEPGDYVYGRSIIVVLGMLPSLEPGIEAFGQIAVLCITVFFCYLVSVHNSRYVTIFIAALVLSPPYQLLIERMNIDIFMFMGLLLAAITFAHGKVPTSLTILTITVLGKFYTLLVLSHYLRVFKGKSLLYFVSFTVVLAAVVLLEYSANSASMPQLGGGAFGFKVLLYWIQRLPNSLFSCLAVILIVASIFLYAKLLRKSLSHNRWSSTSLTPTQMTTLRFFSICSLTIYTASSNWDYRLIFLNVPFFIIICFAYNISKLLRIGLYLLFIAINFLSFNVSGPLQIMGDIAIVFALVTFIKFSYSKQ